MVTVAEVGRAVVDGEGDRTKEQTEQAVHDSSKVVCTQYTII
jgi:hypothetical protein